jgi:hypothetical protein
MPDRKNFLSIERAHVFSFFLTSWCRTFRFFTPENAKNPRNHWRFDASFAPIRQIVNMMLRTIERPEWKSVYFLEWFKSTFINAGERAQLTC